MNKFISSYMEQSKIFLADTDSYTIIKHGFTESDLFLSIKSAVLLYDNVLIPAAYMWQSMPMSEVMYRIEPLILTEKVLPVIRKNKETRDIKDYFEKRQAETAILKKLDVYKRPELSSEIATDSNRKDMEKIHDLKVCLHLEDKSVKNEFIKLWHNDLDNCLNIYSIAGILYQSNISATECKPIIQELKQNVDYERFSRSLLVDYISKMGFNSKIRSKIEERISWLYLKANAKASDSDFYLSVDMSNPIVYKANLKIYLDLMTHFGISRDMIDSLSCEDIIRIKCSPEYSGFISQYIQIVNDIYLEQQNIHDTANKRIESIIKNENKKKNIIQKLSWIMSKSSVIFIGLLINYFSGSRIDSKVLAVSGGASLFSVIINKFGGLTELCGETSFADFKEYILKEQYKKKMNQFISGVII